MITIENLIRLFFVLIHIFILISYSSVLYSVRRASEQTQIHLPMPWKLLMLITFLFVIFNILFVVIVKL